MASCRSCGTTIEEGGRCPECDEPMGCGSPTDTEELVAVLRTADCNLLPVVKGVLEAAQIPFLVQGEEAMGMIPLGPFGGGMFRDVLGASVWVPRSRADEALALLSSNANPPEDA